MEMLRRVHEKFTLHYSLTLPPIGREMPVHPMQMFLLCVKTNALYVTLASFGAQDTGISVRKRVIKILRDICLEQPTFSKVTEMCVRMIRRVNDEEGIKVWNNCTFYFLTISVILFIYHASFWINLYCNVSITKTGTKYRSKQMT